MNDPVSIQAGLVDIDKVPTMKRVISASLINMLRVKSGLKHFNAYVEITVNGKVETTFIKT